jgi:hypothetical protein
MYTRDLSAKSHAEPEMNITIIMNPPTPATPNATNATNATNHTTPTNATNHTSPSMNVTIIINNAT